MNEPERKVYLEQFTRRTHVLGRAVCVITLVLLVGAPFLIGTFLGAMPDMGAVGKGFLSVGVVWAVASVAEFLTRPCSARAAATLPSSPATSST